MSQRHVEKNLQMLKIKVIDELRKVGRLQEGLNFQLIDLD